MDGVFYTDFYDLLERFSIMTIDGNVSDNEAMEYCRQHTTPALAAELEARFIKRPNMEATDTLESYLQNNIALIPESKTEKKPAIAYKEHPENMIKDLQTLNAWKQKGFFAYGFIPSANNLLILDLDRGNTHANQADGIENFTRLVQSATLNGKLKGYFENFPANFPCYTQTPSGGIHLYFKASYITPEIKQSFETARLKGQNIEIKYNDKVTAAGSIRNGNKYTMHGNFEAIPESTFDLLDLLTKEPPKPIKRQYKHYEKTDGEKWNATPEGIIDKANELYSGYANHDFIYKTAVLFHNAGMEKATAERYIMQTPQHLQRQNQADTQTAINSIYK